jgi:hypothetical protein
MRDKIALEEHIASAAMNALWDDAGEASRNGKEYAARVFGIESSDRVDGRATAVASVSRREVPPRAVSSLHGSGF